MEHEFETKPIKLVNFVSEDQLDQARKNRGERVDDGTAQRNRPLYEILRENKEKKDAEFNERFKHRPPKALDEDETEFLEKLETSRKEYEQQIADEDAVQLRCFQEAVASQAAIIHKLKETPNAPKTESRPAVKRSENFRTGNFVISVKPQPKKAKTENTASVPADFQCPSKISYKGSSEELPLESTLGGLVSYSDGSDDD